MSTRKKACTIAILILLAGMAHASIPSRVADDAGNQNTLQLAQNKAAGAGGRRAAGDGTPLPNGARAIRESYGDWAVECRILGIVRKCHMGQYQEDGTGRKMIAMDISAPENGVARVALLMPFGLSLADGIRLQVDERDLAREGRFATCVKDGCLVPLTFSDAEISKLAGARTLTIVATIYGRGTTPAFQISLNGFAAALTRLKTLTQA